MLSDLRFPLMAKKEIDSNEDETNLNQCVVDALVADLILGYVFNGDIDDALRLLGMFVPYNSAYFTFLQ